MTRSRALRRWVIVVIGLIVAGVAAANVRANWLGTPLVSGTRIEPGQTHDTLFVLVHGMGGDREGTWAAAWPELRKKGDILAVNYPGFVLSNAVPDVIASEISEAVASAVERGRYERVVLVGYSMGALLVRKAYLYGRGDVGVGHAPRPWIARVDRIVLLAGMNRGWSHRADRPLDMGMGRYWQFAIGWWLARLTGTGELIRSMEVGAPFVANLRLDWMRALRDESKPVPPMVVQLLGDIDDVVSDEDNKDLRASVAPRFAWLRVRGTGHADIVRFDDPAREGGAQTLGAYRLAKFVRAVTAPLEEVRRDNEEQAFQTDDRVAHVVFVLHGIRDLGRWSAAFESALVAEHRKRRGEGSVLAIASVRYGFFGMGPFLLRVDRQRHVRWFMDVYTETLARYPRAGTVDFVGHSNGTYLLADALQRYNAMKVRRVVFAGSVVRREFDWDAVVTRGQVQLVRNYVASDDWVVALFPRFFEQRPWRFLGNDIGSAGFNGFAREGPTPADAVVKNIKFIQGQHSAFLRQVDEVVEFLLEPGDRVNVARGSEADRCPGMARWSPCRILKAVSDDWTSVVWLALATVVVAGGVLTFRLAAPLGTTRRLLLLTGYVAVIGYVLYKA
jgi:predicted esterase